MTVEDALLIKQWRLQEGCSWRSISLRTHLLSTKEEPEENQLVGRWLCTEAQILLGEDWED